MSIICRWRCPPCPDPYHKPPPLSPQAPVFSILLLNRFPNSLACSLWDLRSPNYSFINASCLPIAIPPAGEVNAHDPAYLLPQLADEIKLEYGGCVTTSVAAGYEFWWVNSQVGTLKKKNGRYLEAGGSPWRDIGVETSAIASRESDHMLG